MFTRYQGIKLPDNYSGNLFAKDHIEDTTTKTHRPNVYGATSTTVSPTFETAYRNETNGNNNINEIAYSDDNMSYHVDDENEDFCEIQNEEEIKDSYSNISGQENFDIISENNNLICENSNDKNSAEDLKSAEECIKNTATEKENSHARNIDCSEDTEKQSNDNHTKKDIHSFKISELLGKIDSDELIILCLILLIASEGNHESDDILPILAILLFSKK